ncbi:hypothetical protein RFI_19087 [Reticulomyxa filosa]|uniref:Mevalonate kinase n=1 Tax=Reticulomyxa filosa TaxID=46433 RepID=X6MXI1_RETFI|nr:hypothetical protein RFI_19087 [Reticulomyxa filosa]|eukprot:ETO18192.1 hypothetical protein RFI_19087 [Reticulomyxa filosa]
MTAKDSLFKVTCGSVSLFLLYKFTLAQLEHRIEDQKVSQDPLSEEKDEFEKFQEILYNHRAFQRILTCSSPGKIILAGEHAVVYGKRAIATAIDKRIYVSVYIPKSVKLEEESNCENRIVLSIYLRFSAIRAHVTFRWSTNEVLDYFETLRSKAGDEYSKLEMFERIQRAMDEDKQCLLSNPRLSFASHKMAHYEYGEGDYNGEAVYSESRSKEFILHFKFQSFFNVFWLAFYQFFLSESNYKHSYFSYLKKKKKKKKHVYICRYVHKCGHYHPSLFYLFQTIFFLKKKKKKPQDKKTQQSNTKEESDGSKESDSNADASANETFEEASLEKIKFSSHDLQSICKWSYECERICHGTPSGIDNTTSVYGQVIQFKSRTDFKVLSLSSQRHRQKFLVIYTGSRGPTKELVANVRRMYVQCESIVKHILEAIELIGDEILALWCTNDSSKNIAESSDDASDASAALKIRQLFSLNHGLLCALGVGHHKIAEIESIVNQYYGSSTSGLKITGAGGGGCLILPWSLHNPNAPHDSGSWMANIKVELRNKGYDCFEVEAGQYGTLCNFYLCV